MLCHAEGLTMNKQELCRLGLPLGTVKNPDVSRAAGIEGRNSLSGASMADLDIAHADIAGWVLGAPDPDPSGEIRAT